MSNTTCYSAATKKGVCWFCDGKKGWHREDDINCGGHPVPAHYEPCGFCGGTGLPSEEQIRKAKLEEQNLCTYCEFEMSLHANQGHPHGCDKAIRTLVRDQRVEIERLKAQVAGRTA